MESIVPMGSYLLQKGEIMAAKKPTQPPIHLNLKTYSTRTSAIPGKNGVTPRTLTKEEKEMLKDSNTDPAVWVQLLVIGIAIVGVGIVVAWLTVLPVTGLFYYMGILK